MDNDWHSVCNVDELRIRAAVTFSECLSRNLSFLVPGNPIGHLAILFKSITSPTITAGARATVRNGKPGGPQSKSKDSEENDYGDNTDHVRRVLCRKMFPFSEELQLSNGLSEHSKPEVEKLKRFQVGSNVQISELT